MALASGDLAWRVGTAITFKTSGGTVAWDFDDTAGQGTLSTVVDLAAVGDSGGPGRYRWYARCYFTGTGLLAGESVNYSLALLDDSSDVFNATAGGGITATLARGTVPIGRIDANSAIESSTDVFTAGGFLDIYHTRIQLLGMNNTSAALETTTTNVNTFTLWHMTQFKVA